MPRRRRLVLLALALVSIAPACTSSSSEPEAGASVTDPAVSAAEMDPCGGDTHPCTAAEVDPPIATASDDLAVAAQTHFGEDGTDVDAAATWLRDQPDVAHVSVGDGVVRFRLVGGRGVWLFANGAANPTLTALSTPATPAPSRRVRATADARHADANDAGGDQGKHALLLSPMAWQWQLEDHPDGVHDLAAAIADVRDYQPENGGSVTVLEDGLGRDSDGTFIDGAIGIEQFRSWARYDYVYLLTHGGFACDDGDEPGDAVGGAANRSTSCVTGLLTSWTDRSVSRAREGAAAGDTAAALELRKVIDSLGIESAWIVIASPKTSLPTGPGLRAEAAHARTTINDGGDGRNRGPTGTEEDPGEPDESRDRDTAMGPFHLLTSAFFADAYPQGLTDTVLFLNACWSGKQADLLQALSGPGSATFGWDKSMWLSAAVAAAQAVTSALLTTEQLTDGPVGGLRIRAAMDAVEEEVRAHLRTSTSGNVPSALLGIVGDELGDPAAGATLGAFGDEDRRLREVAYLVDENGEDLSTAGVQVEGSPGDGEDDDLLLGVRVDGLDADLDPSAASLAVIVDGQRHDLDERLTRSVRPGVWETTAIVPLGRDHQPEETVELEVVVLLPEGQESRWLYRDVPVGGGCWFRFSYAGTATRSGTTDVFDSEAGWSSAEDSQGGVVQVVAVDRSGMTEDVRQVRLSDFAPLRATVQFGDAELPGPIELGRTGTFTLVGGMAFWTSAADLDRTFEAGGEIEVTVTTNEVLERDDAAPVVAVLSGTFRNAGTLVFDNPFPENGTRAEVTSLSGSFRLDREACGGFTW